jgi:hypothetical protein
LPETWHLLEPDEVPSEPDYQLHPRPHHDLHCACGRFAKFKSERYYYNGTYDCYSFDVECARCGVTTIECV